MFRHVVLFNWTEETGPGDVEEISRGLAELPSVIEEIRSYRFGPDLGVNEGNHDFALVADFDDRGAYLAYRDHPVHRKLIDELIKPHLAGRAAVQYEL